MEPKRSHWVVPPVMAALGALITWSLTPLLGSYELVLGDYLLGAGIGLLLGVVMVMTIRGYGYVRGDGEPGSKPHIPVGEEEGFYWRT